MSDPSPSPQPSHVLRLILFAVLLTQLPALPFVLLDRPPAATLGLYAVASFFAAAGFVWAGMRWWNRIERIVGLVRSYSQHGRLPASEGGKSPSVRSVTTSLRTLDATVRRLENDSALDPLTGVLNRRMSAARLEGDLARSRRSGESFSLALFDLDNLKDINDEHGHQVGDEALKALASVLKAVTRSGDWVARWGGDEFLLGLWGADAKAAAGIVERARGCLSQRPLVAASATVSLDASYGVAEANEKDDAEALFHRCDGALLATKRERRGKVGPNR